MSKKNPGKLEAKIMRIVNWIPVIIVYAMFIYSYYVYTVVFCAHYLIYVVHQKVKSALYQGFFQLLFFLSMFDFSRAVFGNPGDTRKLQLHIPQLIGPRNKDSIELDGNTTGYCALCRQYKPVRTHHCSDCGMCCLKMDHHCVFLNNCVGFGNYKNFYLLSFWGSLLCIFVFTTLLQVLIWQLSVGRTVPNSVQFLIVCCFALVMGMGLIILFGFHTYIIVRGRTTIEQITWKEFKEDPKNNPRPPQYTEGWRHNFTQILGPKWYLWLLPYANSKGKGTHYIESTNINNSYESGV